MKITAIKQQVKRQGRYSIYIDGAYAFSLSESGLLAQGLATGQEIDKAQLAALKETSGADKAYNNALRYVAMRPRSEWEMQTYLRRKAVEEPVAEQIVGRLRAAGLLDDAAFARAWVSTRRLLKSASKLRLQLELKQKHVPERIVEQVLEDRADEDELDALRELTAKKRRRYPDELKLTQYLARQGFRYDDIKTVLRGADADR